MKIFDKIKYLFRVPAEEVPEGENGCRFPLTSIAEAAHVAYRLRLVAASLLILTDGPPVTRFLPSSLEAYRY